MSAKLRVIFISPEMAPYAKSGEMADVASALPKYLSYLGMEVSVFIPMYRRPEIESLPKETVTSELAVSLGDVQTKARVYKSELGRYDVYLIDNPKYFLRENIYGTGKGEYLDNDERFVFFSRAVLEFLCKERISADIIHCNNWPTALVPVLLKTQYSKRRWLSGAATVFTLHNISYQGVFPPETLSLTGLNWSYFSPAQLSLNGQFNFLQAGILFADTINTVSASYKREILTRRHGFGLQDLLKQRKRVFSSIRNGVDYEIWDPQNDPYIESNYSASRMEGKSINKSDLCRELGLTIGPEVPLISVVSYMTANKGFDILREAMEDLLKLDLGFVILGFGDEEYERAFLSLQKKHAGRLACKVDMSTPLLHKVAAGADISLIPSRYEPCGLNQLYSFRYGTVPVVRATGGLQETVKPFNVKTQSGNGFVFKEYSPEAIVEAIERAIQCYKKPELWKRIVKNGFTEDFSWERAAKRYAKLYERSLQIKRGG
ncbi:MAG: glycogen/starch synthase [Candidatus Aminicenantes bacterium]|jgi:starch synthase